MSNHSVVFRTFSLGRARAVVAALAFATAASALACSAANGPSGPTAAEAQASTQARAPHAAFAALIDESVGKLDLSPERRAKVDAIRAELRAKSEPVKEATSDLAATVADGVEKGVLDHPAIDRRIDGLTQAMAANGAAMQDSMVKLHDTLDASQRKALVESIRARGERFHHEAGEEHHARGEGHGGGPGARMEKLAKDLDLRPDQIDAIRSKAREGMRGSVGAFREHMSKTRGHMKEIAEAFESDSFDPKALEVGKNAPEMARAFATRMTRFVEIALPVLTPEQRAKLAVEIRARGGEWR